MTATDRAAADAQVPGWVVGGVAAAVTAGCFACGVIVGYVFGMDRAFSAWNFGAQTDAADTKLTTDLSLHFLAPMDMRLSVVPRAEFDRLASARNVLAFTYVSQQPCRIVVPAEWAIVYKPSARTAFWDRADQASDLAADVIAHEILHCQIGTWHPEP